MFNLIFSFLFNFVLRDDGDVIPYGYRTAAGFIRFLFFLSLWDRIVPAFAKRLAAQKTPQTQKKADNNAPFLYCLYGILGAGGIKTAIGAQTG